MEEATLIHSRLKKIAPLNQEQVGIGFRALWQMKLKYPIGATCFTKKLCANIQARYLPTFLSKMGIKRTTATAVRHGPTSLGGMNVIHLLLSRPGKKARQYVDQCYASNTWAFLNRIGIHIRMEPTTCGCNRNASGTDS
jgi:hypothetical protein